MLTIEYTTNDPDNIVIYDQTSNEMLGTVTVKSLVENKALYERLAHEFRELIQIG